MNALTKEKQEVCIYSVIEVCLALINKILAIYFNVSSVFIIVLFITCHFLFLIVVEESGDGHFSRITGCTCSIESTELLISGIPESECIEYYSIMLSDDVISIDWVVILVSYEKDFFVIMANDSAVEMN